MYIVYVFNIHVYMQIYYVFIWFSVVSSPFLSLCNMDLWLKFVWRNQELHEFRSAETRSDSDSSRFRLSVLGFRLSVSAFGFRFPAFGFRPPFSDCFRFWFSAFGFRCSAFGFRLSVSGFRLSPSGFVSLSAFGFRIGGQRGWNSVHASHMSKPVM